MKTDELKAFAKEINAHLAKLESSAIRLELSPTLKEWCDRLINEDIDNLSYSEAELHFYKSSNYLREFILEEAMLPVSFVNEHPLQAEVFLISLKLKKINDEFADRWRRAVLLGQHQRPYEKVPAMVAVGAARNG